MLNKLRSRDLADNSCSKLTLTNNTGHTAENKLLIQAACDIHRGGLASISPKKLTFRLQMLEALRYTDDAVRRRDYLIASIVQ